MVRKLSCVLPCSNRCFLSLFTLWLHIDPGFTIYFCFPQKMKLGDSSNKDFIWLGDGPNQAISYLARNYSYVRYLSKSADVCHTIMDGFEIFCQDAKLGCQFSIHTIKCTNLSLFAMFLHQPNFYLVMGFI